MQHFNRLGPHNYHEPPKVADGLPLGYTSIQPGAPKAEIPQIPGTRTSVEILWNQPVAYVMWSWPIWHSKSR